MNPFCGHGVYFRIFSQQFNLVIPYNLRVHSMCIWWISSTRWPLEPSSSSKLPIKNSVKIHSQKKHSSRESPFANTKLHALDGSKCQAVTTSELWTLQPTNLLMSMKKERRFRRFEERVSGSCWISEKDTMDASQTNAPANTPWQTQCRFKRLDRHIDFTLKSHSLTSAAKSFV